jgi:hypothetical protein
VLNLHRIARALGGRVRRNSVTAPGPEAAAKRGWKRKRHTLTTWISDDGQNIFVNSHGGVGWREAKDWVRQQCGIEPWTSDQKTRPRRSPAQKHGRPGGPPQDLFTRETVRCLRDARFCTREQFALLIDDHRNAGGSLTAAQQYAREFGFSAADLQRAFSAPPRCNSADERAAILSMSYERRQRLHLRVTGSIDASKDRRERLRRDRYNISRKAKRARGRLVRAGLHASLNRRQFEDQARAFLLGQLRGALRMALSGVNRESPRVCSQEDSASGVVGMNFWRLRARGRAAPWISASGWSGSTSDGVHRPPAVGRCPLRCGLALWGVPH